MKQTRNTLALLVSICVMLTWQDVRFNKAGLKKQRIHFQLRQDFDVMLSIWHLHTQVREPGISVSCTSAQTDPQRKQCLPSTNTAIASNIACYAGKCFRARCNKTKDAELQNTAEPLACGPSFHSRVWGAASRCRVCASALEPRRIASIPAVPQAPRYR